MLKYILFVFDGTPRSHNGLAFARDLARENHAQLHILSVMSPAWSTLDLPTDFYAAEVVESRREMLASRLASLKNECLSQGVHTTATLRLGNELVEIVRYAVEYRISQIVIACAYHTIKDRWVSRRMISRLLWL